jgi:fatty-acyl-CoA synthase
MRLVDVDTGEVVALGEQGEICCRGYQVMLGYYELPEATAQTIDADGWLHMGDLGVMDERGFLKVTGRLKDMIIRGGMNLYPAEIEEVLVTHTAFADVAVLGVPDERWGEIVGAVVRLREATELPPLDELKVWVRERISAHKTPAAWYVTTDYPLTPSGKIQKFVLREQIADGTLVAVATVGETSSIPTID